MKGVISVPITLQWLLGMENVGPQRKVQFDWSDFEWAEQHRVIWRVWKRLGDNPENYKDRDVLNALRQRAQGVRVHFEKQIDAIREIAAHLGSADTPLVVVKGPSAYCITKDPMHIRRSNDIDLLFHDTDLLTEALLDLGYIQVGSPADHEVGQYCRGKVRVDVHKYFPVYAYDNSTGSNSRRIVAVRPHRHVSEVTYQDITSQFAAPGVSPDEAWVVPNATMSAFIACAHAYGNYEDALYSRRMVRLWELLELFDLFRHESFNGDVWSLLLDGYNGRLSWSFVHHAFRACFGRNLSTHAVQDYESLDVDVCVGFPQRIGEEFALLVDWEPGELLSGVSMSKVVHKLGPVRIQTPETGESKRRVRLCSTTSGKGFDTRDKPLGFELAVEWDMERLAFEVRIPPGTYESHCYLIAVLPRRRTEIHCGRQWEEFSIVGPHHSASMEVDWTRKSCLFTWEYDWYALVPQLSPLMDEIPCLFIMACDFDGFCWRKADTFPVLLCQGNWR